MAPSNTVLDRTLAAGDADRQHAATARRILVVDDESGVVEALRLLLHAHGFTVVVASSPVEALEAARSYPLHAALVDLNYGKGRTTGEQGLELVAALARIDGALPIVAMTGWSSSDLAREAARRGARDFVEKPWDESQLVSLLKGYAELGSALRRIAELESEVQRLRAGADNGGLSAMRLFDVEGTLVRQAIEKHRGNISRTARALGLSRSALYRRLERHKID